MDSRFRGNDVRAGMPSAAEAQARAGLFVM